MEKTKWNKKIFAMLLESAKGVRSWRQFAADCGISYVQMRKLAMGTQENPPRPKLIRKVADHAFGEIDLEDLMFAAGMCGGDQTLPGRAADRSDSFAVYRTLSPRDRAAADKFIAFLKSSAEESGSKQ